MNIDKERRFFDAFQAHHGEYDVLTEQGYERLLDKFGAHVGLRPGASCIDLGCGTGAFTRRLSARGLAMTGVDVSPGSIARAQRLGGGQFVVGDIRHTNLPAASFDAAVMSGVLHHIPTREDRVKSLREALRLLKPGGRLFCFDPNGHSPSMFLHRDPRSPFHSKEGKTDNEVLLTRRQLESDITAAGFEQVAVNAVGGITFRFVFGRIARAMLPLYNRVYEPLIRRSPFERMLGTFLISTAAKAERSLRVVAER